MSRVATLSEAFTLGIEDRCEGRPMTAHETIPPGSEQGDAYAFGYFGADLRIGDGAVARAHRVTADTVNAYIEEKQFFGLLPHENRCGVKAAPACETNAPAPMTLEQFRATRREVIDVRTIADYHTDDEMPGYVYVDSLVIERHGGLVYMIIGNVEWTEPKEKLTELEQILYAFAIDERLIARPDTAQGQIAADMPRALQVWRKAQADLGADLGGFSLVDLLADNFPEFPLDYCRAIAAQLKAEDASKTPGQRDYERAVAKQPTYPHNGKPRPSWYQLSKHARDSWQRNATHYQRAITGADPKLTRKLIDGLKRSQ